MLTGPVLTGEDLHEQLSWHWEARLRPRLAGLTDGEAQWPPGSSDERYPLWAVVLHVNAEVIHHGAEVALLRDLYRSR